MSNSALKPWKELSRTERAERLGDPARWETPTATRDAREIELLHRFDVGLPLSRVDRKEARALLRARRA